MSSEDATLSRARGSASTWPWPLPLRSPGRIWGRLAWIPRGRALGDESWRWQSTLVVCAYLCVPRERESAPDGAGIGGSSAKQKQTVEGDEGRVDDACKRTHLADTIEPSTRFCALCSFLMSDRMSSSRLRSASRRTSCSSTSVASRPRSDRACWTMSASTSSRSAMFKAQLRPGTPQMSLYVGWRLTSSNSTLAFSKTPVSPWYLSDVRTLWWVLASVSPDPPGPSRANVFMRAIPRAAPSMASVPVPSSSSRTRLLPVDSSRKPSMRLKCPLKVERLADRLCSSPMSA
mmetsp:Transcript_9783/g.26570  ORF Transcript_9783/g.26570 Transcript_9783/m.26570 type:complete len:290 (-) Transcript_9783:2387-3256(-)